MGLLKKRYMCVFSLLFVLSAFVGASIGVRLNILLVASLLLLSLLGMIFLLINKKRRFAFAVAFMCAVFAASGALNSFLFVTLPQSRASEYIGRQTVVLKIISPEESDEHYSEYNVKIIQVGEKSENIKGYLYCDFPSELSYGEQIIANCELKDADTHNKDRDILLDIYLTEGEKVLYKKYEGGGEFSLDAVAASLSGFRNKFSSYVDSIFDEDSRGLIKGFLISDKSDIANKTSTDFRRSGVSHLLSVSGLHMAILLGGLEMLLRKLWVSRKLRCALVIVCGIFYLALTSFAASAVRSALMLFGVYAAYVFGEESDGLTALFASVFLIVLVSPYSIFDLGLLMSFAATLGLLSVYPYFEQKLPRIKSKKRAPKLLERIYLGIARAILITIVANFFLLPIIWYFFGEISLTSIPANLLLSPLSAIYLPLGVLSLTIGKIPFLGAAIVKLVSALGYLIVKIAEIFSAAGGAVISLNYPFTALLVIAFAVAMAVLLVVELKHKALVCLPIAVFTLLFSLSVFLYSINVQGKLSYIDNGNDDYIMLQKGRYVTVCDMAHSGSRAYRTVKENINPAATEIENYIITHAHASHAYGVEKTLEYFYVKNLYLPLPSDKDEQMYVLKIYNLAKEYNTKIIFYKSGEEIKAFDEVYLKIDDGNSSISVGVYEGTELKRDYIITRESRAQT